MMLPDINDNWDRNGEGSTQTLESAWLVRGRNGVAIQVSGVEGLLWSQNMSSDSISILYRKDKLRNVRTYISHVVLQAA